MRQLTCTAAGTLKWQEVPFPALQGPMEAVIRPVAVARCEIDPVLIAGGTSSFGPWAVGHEAVAEVLAVGDDVTEVAPGQLVVPSFQACCGRCDPCQRGLTAICAEYPILSDYGMAPLSSTEYGGMISDAVRVPHAAAMLRPVPPGVSALEVAGAADNLADGYRGVAAHLAQRPGATVLVVCHGQRSIGLFAAHAAVALGSAGVTVASDDPDVLTRAASLGASALPTNYERRAGRWPIVVDCGNRPDGLAYAIASTEPEGVLQSLSYYFEPQLPLPLGKLYTLGIRFFIGRVHSAALLTEVLELIGRRRLSPLSIGPTIVEWDDVERHYLDPALKLVVARPEAAA